MQLTKAQLIAATGCGAALADRYTAPLNATLAKFAINTPLRVAHFLAQIGHESIGFSATTESLDYTVDKLLAVFGRHRISEADARKFGRIPGLQQATQSAIGNLIYGGPFGVKNLGNTQPGDGYRFRGRGAMQITGRANYKALGIALGIDLVAAPERLAEPELWAMCAGWFWNARNLNPLADANKFEAITRKINGGVNGYDDRLKRFLRAAKVLLPTTAVVLS